MPRLESRQSAAESAREPITFFVSNLQGQFRSLIENAATGAVVVDSQSVIQLISRAGLEMFGYDSPQELIGQRVEVLIPERFRATHSSHVRSYFQAAISRAIGVGRPLTAIRRDGREFAVEICLSPIILDDQMLAVAWIQNVEARQKLQTQVRQYRDRLAHASRVAFAAEMVAGIAHELSQPLTAITMYAESIKLRLQTVGAGDAEIDEFTDNMVDQAIRAGEIVRGLRAFIDHHHTPSATTSIARIIDNAIHFMENELRCAGVEIDCDLLPNLPGVRVIEIQIAQVLANLIRNAMDALVDVPQDQRQLRITAEPCDTGVRVLVDDSGPGFSPQAKEKAFEAFYSTKQKGQGMGVGLAMCRTIVEAHRGQIAVGDSPLGGARISFSLPAAADQTPLSPDSAPARVDQCVEPGV